MVNTNVRGSLTGKLDDIKVIKDNYGVDVNAITETWCTSNISDGPLSLSGLTFTGGADNTTANPEVSPAMFETRFQLNTGPN